MITGCFAEIYAYSGCRWPFAVVCGHDIDATIANAFGSTNRPVDCIEPRTEGTCEVVFCPRPKRTGAVYPTFSAAPEITAVTHSPPFTGANGAPTTKHAVPWPWPEAPLGAREGSAQCAGQLGPAVAVVVGEKPSAYRAFFLPIDKYGCRLHYPRKIRSTTRLGSCHFGCCCFRCCPKAMGPRRSNPPGHWCLFSRGGQVRQGLFGQALGREALDCNIGAEHIHSK